MEKDKTVSTPKARRAAKACDSCRRRKERCNGQHPRCEPCRTGGRACQYSSKVKKRGLREGWVRSLEKLLALATLCRPDVEQVVVSTLDEGVRDPSIGAFVAQWSDESHEHGLLKRWRRSALAERLSELLPELEKMPPQKLPPSGPGQVCLPSYPSGSENLLDDTASLAPPTDLGNPADFDHHVAQSPVALPLNPADAQATDAEKDVLPPNSLELLHSYFACCHTWFPIVEKPEIYRIFYRCRQDSSQLRSAEVAPLLAILHYMRPRCPPPAPDTITGDADEKLHEVAERLFDRARSLIPLDGEAIELSHAQALLILSLTYLRRGLLVGAAMLVAQATRIATIVRVSPPPQDDYATKPPRLGDRLPHVLRACFTLEAVIATRLHTPAPSPTSFGEGIPEVLEDGAEEWLPVNSGFSQESSSMSSVGPLLALSTFNQLGQAAQDMTAAFRACQSVPEGDPYLLKQLLDHSLAGVLHSDYSSIEPVMPHKLTVDLFRHLTLLLLVPCTSLERSRYTLSLETIERISDRLRNFCSSFKSNLECMDKYSIVPMWESLWAIMFERIDQWRGPYLSNECCVKTLESVQEVITSLANVDDSPAMTSLQFRVDISRGSQVAQSSPAITAEAMVLDSTSLNAAPTFALERQSNIPLAGEITKASLTRNVALDRTVSESSLVSGRPIDPTASRHDLDMPAGRGPLFPSNAIVETQQSSDSGSYGMSGVSSTGVDFMAIDATYW